MNPKIIISIFCFSIVTILVYSHYLNSVNAQNIGWKKYTDPGQKFSFLYPPNWLMKSMHDNITGTTNVILESPDSNSSRMQVSFLYNPNESLLSSKTGKQVLPSRALTNLEKEISDDFIFFNSTGQFPHKYSIEKFQSASDVIDYERNENKPGKMLIVFTKVNDKDSFVITYSDSKRLFYKNLSNISQIIKSIEITE